MAHNLFVGYLFPAEGGMCICTCFHNIYHIFLFHFIIYTINLIVNTHSHSEQFALDDLSCVIVNLLCNLNCNHNWIKWKAIDGPFGRNFVAIIVRPKVDQISWVVDATTNHHKRWLLSNSACSILISWADFYLWIIIITAVNVKLAYKWHFMF